MSEIKDINQAISVLIQGCIIAQSKGSYTLEEAEIISQAIKFIKKISEENQKAEATVENKILKD